MGGRGASSMTSKVMVTSPSGSYPKSMESLLDQNGRISLDLHDYYNGLDPKYTRDEIEAFVATLPYEATVYFAPNGDINYINSQYRPGSVGVNLTKVSNSFGTGDDGYVDFHNHPIVITDTSWVYPIFSPRDIGTYVIETSRRTTNFFMPSVFTVGAQNGMRFTLEYVGGGRRDPANFQKAYSSMFTKVKKKARADAFQAYNDGVYDTRVERNTALVAAVTEQMDDYLRTIAPEYGFRYNSNLQ